MEYNPIESLFNEHDIICKAQEIVEHLENTWVSSPDKYETTLLRLLHFFREYADGYHHRKEEEILFPALKNHPDFVLEEILDEFEQHHEDFRESLSEIERSLVAEDYERSYRLLVAYLQDLLDHISAENDELFVLAETLMSEEQLETIYFKFKDIDMELGEINKIELENQLHALSEA